MERIEEVEVKIREAVDCAKKNGWTIESGYFWFSDFSCCPLGAVIVCNPPEEFHSAGVDLANWLYESGDDSWVTSEQGICGRLGITESELHSFYWGFDQIIDTPYHPDELFYNLGKKFREELLG